MRAYLGKDLGIIESVLICKMNDVCLNNMVLRSRKEPASKELEQLRELEKLSGTLKTCCIPHSFSLGFFRPHCTRHR